MAKWIKVGQRFINTDRFYTFSIDRDGAVGFAAPLEATADLTSPIPAKDAVELVAWLRKQGSEAAEPG